MAGRSSSISLLCPFPALSADAFALARMLALPIEPGIWGDSSSQTRNSNDWADCAVKGSNGECARVVAHFVMRGLTRPRLRSLSNSKPTSDLPPGSEPIVKLEWPC